MSLGAPKCASAAIDLLELAEGDTLIPFDCEYVESNGMAQAEMDVNGGGGASSTTGLIH